MDAELGKMRQETTSRPALSTDPSADIASAGNSGWAEVVKRNRKVAKKNLLVVKPSDENKTVKDIKNEVSQALSEVQIADSRFTNKGNIVMNFENEAMRDEAAVKLENVQQVKAELVKKLNPKIMICNVFKEETEDRIIQTVIRRNEYLRDIQGVENKMELIFCKPAAGGTKHFILRCQPEVREVIHKNYDKVLLDWGSYIVRDRYHAPICFHCQRYGHQANKCTSKMNGDHPCCFKCAGQHKSVDCTETEKKCINCMI